MGGGKRRKHTAKTGDKALYKSRPVSHTSSKDDNSDDDDRMYNAVDRFHNGQEEFLKLDAGNSSSEEEEDDGISGREAVLNLDGVESGSSSSSEDDSSVEEEPAALVTRERQKAESFSSDDDSSDEDNDERLELQESNVRDWGSKKSAYYHGDTADLEIGQDEQDAFLEEEAAQQVQEARYKQMEEEDFMLSDDEDEEKPTAKGKEKSIDIRGTRDLSKLSKSDKRRLLQSHHPELLPLVSHFKDVVEEWNDRTSVVAKAVLEGDEGTIEVSYICA